MATQAALDNITQKLNELATKGDLQNLTTLFMDKIQQLETRLYGLETERDILKTDVEKVKRENVALRAEISSLRSSVSKEFNNTEQYSRRWNLRVFGIKQTQNEDVTEKCIKLFTEKVGVTTRADDVQVAHRVSTGHQSPQTQQETHRPPAVIVQFSSRRVRDEILRKRKVLARTGITITEDLTKKNFEILKKAQAHSCTTTAWSSNGKIIVQLKNGKKLKIDIDTDLDAFFNRHLAQ